MKYDIIITNQAEVDMQDIYEYIEMQLSAPISAKRLLNKMISCIMNLRELPNRYRKYEHEPWQPKGLRVLPVNNFLILYIPDEKDRKVHIIRVIYGKRDIDNALGDIE